MVSRKFDKIDNKKDIDPLSDIYRISKISRKLHTR